MLFACITITLIKLFAGITIACTVLFVGITIALIKLFADTLYNCMYNAVCRYNYNYCRILFAGL